MSSWGATQAKAQFSAMLDKAETEGPQLVRRRKQEFYVLTKEQLAERTERPVEGEKPFVSGWDALRPSSELCFDYDFPRAKGKARAANFECHPGYERSVSNENAGARPAGITLVAAAGALGSVAQCRYDS